MKTVMARDFWREALILYIYSMTSVSSVIRSTLLSSSAVMETFWRRPSSQ
jgi:hypothetical protein